MSSAHSGGDLSRRVIEPRDFVADTEAFVDVRIERSKGKASYSFIGPGVSQNANQVINLIEPHGFNIGAATMPSGVINNPHLHFTAEVFICTRGSFTFSIGEHGGQDVVIGPGTIFSVPTWVFRSFQNTGPDDGWVFTVLGGDETGGIIWAPHILEEAAATGLYIDDRYAVLDAVAGDDVSNAVRPLDAAALDGFVATYTDAEIGERIVEQGALVWSSRGLLSSVLDGHHASTAPVIGFGMTQDRTAASPIANPHGFSVEWLRVEPGASVGRHRHGDSQALFLIEGAWKVEIEAEGERELALPLEGSVVSIPADTWRDFSNVGDTPALAVVVCSSDSPTAIEWSPEIVALARDAGWAIDAAGYLAPTALIGGGT